MRTTSPARRGVSLTLFLSLLLLASLPACAPGLGPRHRSLTRELPRESPIAASASAVDLRLGSPVLSRHALIRAVLERNPTVRSAEFAFRAALSRYPQSTALDDPQIAYGVAPASFGSSTVNDAHKVELRQHLPFPGKLRLRGAEALARAEAAKHDLASVRLELVAVASLLFDDYYYLTRAISINAEHVALLETFKAIATARYEAGQGSQQDPLQAESELAHLVHEGVVLRTRLSVVSQRINTLLHRPPDYELPEAPPSLTPLAVPVVESAGEVRPELQAAASVIEAEEASVAYAWREFLPDFTLVGAYNSLWQNDDLQPFVGLQLNVPLQLGRRRAAVDEAEANLGRARAELARISDELRFSVSKARSLLDEAEHVLTLYRDRLLPPASDRVRAARAGFETGRNSFLVLIDAEQNLRTTSLGLERARAERSQARTELLRALGVLSARAAEVSK